MKLKDKVAIITGGGTGIGKACAVLFASEGAQVVITGRREEKLITTAEEIRSRGGEVLHLKADISKVGETERVAESCVEHFGGIDILVNNAGVYKGGSLTGITEETYDYVMDINLKGTFFMSKNAVAHMLGKGGSIINIGSALGIGGWKDASTSVYSASKGGISMLTKALALELAREKIRVNCVCPAVVETEVFETMGIPKDKIAERMRQWNSFHPLGRNGQPEEVALAVLYFASEDSSWVTGSVFNIDGGATAAQVIYTRWEPE